MKVKTTIKFEVEYPLSLEFYETDDEEKALEMERACVIGDPVGMIDAFGARGNGEFTVSVEKIAKKSPTGNIVILTSPNDKKMELSDNWENILLPDILFQTLITKKPNEIVRQEWLSDLHDQGYIAVRLTSFGDCIKVEGVKAEEHGEEQEISTT